MAGILICVAHAQEVAHIDLRPTEGSELAQDIPQLSRQNGCPKDSGWLIDGDVKSNALKRIVLSVGLTNAHRAPLGKEIEAEITMRNTGPMVVEIPWTLNPRGLRVGEDDDYEQWETGEFLVFLRKDNGFTKLKSLAKLLYSSPFSPGSGLKLQPGEWVSATIKFKLAPVYPEWDEVKAGKFQLVAEWYQEQRTYKRVGCNINSGYLRYKKYYQQDQKKTKFTVVRSD